MFFVLCRLPANSDRVAVMLKSISLEYNSFVCSGNRYRRTCSVFMSSLSAACFHCCEFE